MRPPKRIASLSQLTETADDGEIGVLILVVCTEASFSFYRHKNEHVQTKLCPVPVLLSAMSLSGPPVPLLEDKETGELRFDLETGEMNQHPITTDDYCCSFMHDMETGEFAREQPPTGKKRVFQVPKNVLRPGRSMNRQGKRGLVPILLPLNQEEPVDKYITPLYLLLPLLLVIPAWMPIMSLYIFLECCLHAWSHRKSRKFNTPLRYLMENYCSTCLTERSAQKIIKMQDERKIRAINRKLAYCAYVKKMSVVS
uniref:Uncharacterized protein n=2 Tax=Timema TaxID=61471 RepID=A0A7R9DX20_9NEOP|nr:unnamed protein product [Timema cristinae]CAD7423287.1 unnamed protein product [Timema monikensis]